MLTINQLNQLSPFRISYNVQYALAIFLKVSCDNDYSNNKRELLYYVYLYDDCRTARALARYT